MVKRVGSSGTKSIKKYDDVEDKEIRQIAYSKEDKLSKFLFCILIILLGISIATTFLSINKFNNKKDVIKDDNIIQIKTYKDNILIVNNGEINENITNDKFNNDNEYVIKNINTIELTSEKNGEDSKSYYNIKYNIMENDFPKNIYSTNNSNVLVRFSYSYDNKDWIYLNNVISTTESTLTPLMGRCYDISGLISNLKVSTNNVLEAKDGESNKIYWKSETIFQNKNKKNINSYFKARFKIEYKEID